MAQKQTIEDYLQRQPAPPQFKLAFPDVCKPVNNAIETHKNRVDVLASRFKQNLATLLTAVCASLTHFKQELAADVLAEREALREVSTLQKTHQNAIATTCKDYSAWLECLEFPPKRVFDKNDMRDFACTIAPLFSQVTSLIEESEVLMKSCVVEETEIKIGQVERSEVVDKGFTAIDSEEAKQHAAAAAAVKEDVFFSSSSVDADVKHHEAEEERLFEAERKKLLHDATLRRFFDLQQEEEKRLKEEEVASKAAAAAKKKQEEEEEKQKQVVESSAATNDVDAKVLEAMQEAKAASESYTPYQELIPVKTDNNNEMHQKKTISVEGLAAISAAKTMFGGGGGESDSESQEDDDDEILEEGKFFEELKRLDELEKQRVNQVRMEEALAVAAVATKTTKTPLRKTTTAEATPPASPPLSSSATKNGQWVFEEEDGTATILGSPEHDENAHMLFFSDGGMYDNKTQLFTPPLNSRISGAEEKQDETALPMVVMSPSVLKVMQEKVDDKVINQNPVHFDETKHKEFDTLVEKFMQRISPNQASVVEPKEGVTLLTLTNPPINEESHSDLTFNLPPAHDELLPPKQDAKEETNNEAVFAIFKQTEERNLPQLAHRSSLANDTSLNETNIPLSPHDKLLLEQGAKVEVVVEKSVQHVLGARIEDEKSVFWCEFTSNPDLTDPPLLQPSAAEEAEASVPNTVVEAASPKHQTTPSPEKQQQIALFQTPPPPQKQDGELQAVFASPSSDSFAEKLKSGAYKKTDLTKMNVARLKKLCTLVNVPNAHKQQKAQIVQLLMSAHPPQN